MIDEKLLAILACPACKAPLRADGDWLVCTKTEVRYPIEDNIPVLLVERAQPRHPEKPDAPNAQIGFSDSGQ